MTIIDVNFHPSRKELRAFALLQVVFFAIVATMVFRKGGSTTTVATIVGVSLIVGLIGGVAPNAIRWIYVVWMAAVFPIGFMVSHIILAVVFYLLFTPIGLLMRLCGRDPMQRKFDSAATTYWQPRSNGTDAKRYFKQF